MRLTQNSMALISVACLTVGGCASANDGAAGVGPSVSATRSATATGSKAASEVPASTVTPSAAPPESTAPTGTLSTKRIDCTVLSLPAPADLKRSNNPAVMCAFESETDYVSIHVTANAARNFDMAKNIEMGNSSGKTEIKPVSADGWTFGARWPGNGGPNIRVQYWLVDAGGKVLLCKLGSDRGESAITELAKVCEQARSVLFAA